MKKQNPIIKCEIINDEVTCEIHSTCREALLMHSVITHGVFEGAYKGAEGDTLKEKADNAVKGMLQLIIAGIAEAINEGSTLKEAKPFLEEALKENMPTMHEDIDTALHKSEPDSETTSEANVILEVLAALLKHETERISKTEKENTK